MPIEWNRTSVFQRFLLAGLVLILVAPATAQNDQDHEHAKITVPENHAKLGRVYYVVDAKAPQVKFRSETNKEKFSGTSTQLLGYVVAPNGEETLSAKLAAGEFRLPVVSFETGNKMRDGHLVTTRWLNKDAYPHIVFTLSAVTDVKLVKEREDRTIYKAKLVGNMSLVGHQEELTVDARIILKPESKKTKRVAPGDLMMIRTDFTIVLSEYGLGIGDMAIETGRVAGKIKVEVNLTLSTEQPNRES